MSRIKHLLYVCSIAMIACSTTAYDASYGSQGLAGGDLSNGGDLSSGGLYSNGGSEGGSAVSGLAGGSDVLGDIIQNIGTDTEGEGNGVPSPCQKMQSKQSIPYSLGTGAKTVSSSITYPQNKGEILIHHPAAIIVKPRPTKVLINHPPLVVKPAPVVLHKPPAVVLRKVVVKHHPRRVKVEPVYVNVVKPPAAKYYVKEKQQAAYSSGYGAGTGSGYGASAGSDYGAGAGSDYGAGTDSGYGASAGSDYGAGAEAAGYKLLQGSELSALTNIANAGNGGYEGSITDQSGYVGETAAYNAGSSAQSSYAAAAPQY